MAIGNNDAEKINRLSERDIINGAESVDLYKFFGVDWKASAAEIKAAYRALSLQYHPDRNQGNPDSEKIFQAINKANEILSQKDKRQKYHDFYENFVNTSAGFAAMNGDGVDWSSYGQSTNDTQSGNTGADNTGPDTSGPSTPGPDTSGPSTPGPDNSGPSTPGPSNPDPNNPGPDNTGLSSTDPNNPPPNEPQVDEPNAYGDFTLNNLHKDKKKNLIPDDGLDAKPVDFDRTEKLELKGDDIMQDLWRLWMYLWKLCVGKPVDWTLDLLNFALYEPFQKHKLAAQEKELEKKDARYYGDKLYENYANKAKKNAGLLSKSFDEIMTNIDNRKAGLPENWRTWRQEPAFFARLVQIEARAAADPNSNEAKFWEKFKSTPEIAKNLFEKEVDLRYLSIHIATLDEAINNPDEYKLPENVAKKIKEMEAILQKETDAQKIKDKIKEKMDELRPEVAGTDYVSQKITEKLNKMERFAIGPETDAQAVKNGFRKTLEEIKEVNPVSQRIEDASKPIYENMMQNIEKIVVLNINDPEAMKENIRGYMTHMFTSVYDLEKASKEFFDHKDDMIEKMKQKTGKGMSYKQKAKDKITSAQDSINNFVVNNREIGTIPQANTLRNNPMAGDRTQSFEFIKNMAERRV